MRRAIVVLLLLVANALFGTNKVKTAPEAHPVREVAQASSPQPIIPWQPLARVRL